MGIEETRTPTDWMNLYSPLRDAVESPGQPGQVLRSQGSGAAPIWAGEGSNSSIPSPGSCTDDGILVSPGPIYACDQPEEGPIVFVPPTAPDGISSFLMHIQGFGLASDGDDQGAIDTLLQVDLENGLPARVHVQGVAADLDLYCARRSDGRIVVVIGNAATKWVEPMISITHLWVAGSPDAASWGSGWTVERPDTFVGWTLTGAQPIGYQQGLGVPDQAGNGGGRYTNCVGGFSAPNVAVGALVWAIPDEVPVQTILHLYGTGMDGAETTVNCWVRLGRGLSRGEPYTDVEVVNMAPAAPPRVRVGVDALGRGCLIVGEIGGVWRRPALALSEVVSSRVLGDIYRPVWVSSLQTNLDSINISGEGVVKPPYGSGGGGPVTLQAHTPGAGLVGAPYDGSAAQAWSVDFSQAPAPKLQALSPGTGLVGSPYDGSMALGWSVDFSKAPPPVLKTLTPGAGINGQPYDGSADVTWTADASGGGTVAIEALTPGLGITGGVYDGITPQTWAVDFSKAPPLTLQAHSPGNGLLGPVYDGTAQVSWSVDFSKAPAPTLATLTPGVGINGQPYNGTQSVTWTVDASGGGTVAIEALTPGRGLSGPVFDGTAAVTWAVNESQFNLALPAITPGNGLQGAPYDGSAAQTWQVDFSKAPAPTLAALTPAGYITGTPYNGTGPVTWTVNGSSAADPNVLMARNADGDTWADVFHGDLNGTALQATKLTPGRKINGVLFDGTADIVIGDVSGGPSIATLTPGAGIAGQPFDGSTAQTWTVDAASLPTPDLQDLSPGAHLSGSAYDGRAAVTWSVNAVEAATPSTVPVRDAGGGLTATPFKGDLTGNSATTTKFYTPRNINGVPFDGTVDITIPIDDPKRVLRAGDTMTGNLNFPGPVYLEALAKVRTTAPALLWAETTVDDQYGVEFTPDGLIQHYANRGHTLIGGGSIYTFEPTGAHFNRPLDVVNPLDTGGVIVAETGNEAAAFAALKLNYNGRGLLHGEKGMRICGTSGYGVVLECDWNNAYRFQANQAAFDRKLIIKPDYSSPTHEGLEIRARGSSDATGHKMCDPNGGVWAELGAVEYRTDYIGRHEVWIRSSGARDWKGFVNLDAPDGTDSPVRISLNGSAQIARCNNNGDWFNKQGNKTAAQAKLLSGLEALSELEPVVFPADEEANATASLGFSLDSLRQACPQAIAEVELEVEPLLRPADAEPRFTRESFVCPTQVIPVVVKAVQELAAVVMPASTLEIDADPVVAKEQLLTALRAARAKVMADLDAAMAIVHELSWNTRPLEALLAAQPVLATEEVLSHATAPVTSDDVAILQSLLSVAIVTRKQELRDLPESPEIAAATTPEELVGAWPTELLGAAPF
jgi:hypothetical protein